MSYVRCIKLILASLHILSGLQSMQSTTNAPCIYSTQNTTGGKYQAMHAVYGFQPVLDCAPDEARTFCVTVALNPAGPCLRAVRTSLEPPEEGEGVSLSRCSNSPPNTPDPRAKDRLGALVGRRGVASDRPGGGTNSLSLNLLSKLAVRDAELAEAGRGDEGREEGRGEEGRVEGRGDDGRDGLVLGVPGLDGSGFGPPDGSLRSGVDAASRAEEGAPASPSLPPSRLLISELMGAEEEGGADDVGAVLELTTSVVVLRRLDAERGREDDLPLLPPLSVVDSWDRDGLGPSLPPELDGLRAGRSPSKLAADALRLSLTSWMYFARPAVLERSDSLGPSASMLGLRLPAEAGLTFFLAVGGLP